MSNLREFQCLECKQEWIIPFGPILAGNCPRCGSIKILARVEVKDRAKSSGRAQSSRFGRSLGRGKGRGDGEEA